MAEHPGAMQHDEFDLVGFAVGVVERPHLVTPDRVPAATWLIGLPSPGCGRTATRSRGERCSMSALVPRRRRLGRRHHSLADELLLPSVIYAPAVRAVADRGDVHGVAHITGGGLVGNVPRMLPRTSTR